MSFAIIRLMPILPVLLTALTLGTLQTPPPNETSFSYLGSMEHWPVRFVRGNEYKAVESKRNDSGTIVTSTKHVLSLSLRLASSADENGNYSLEVVDQGSGGGGSTYDIRNYPGYVWVDVASPAEMSALDTGAGTGPVAATTNMGSVLRFRLNSGKEAKINLAAATDLSGGSIQLRIYYPAQVVTYNSQTQTYDYSWNYSVVHPVDYTFGVTKNAMSDASIDTRKLYGQANRAGQVIADPNTEPRNNNFGDWVFKGGLFVGNVSSTGKDRSGLARAQFWTGLDTSLPMLAVASTFCMGSPSSYTEDLTIGVFAPLDNDSNLTKTEANATWATRWSITPRPEVPQNETKSPDKDPIRKRTLTSSSANEYVSTTLSLVKDKLLQTPASNNNSLGTTSFEFKTVFETPHEALKRLVYAIHYEEAFAGLGYQGWKYFASKETAADATAFPLRDAAPRLWLVNLTSSAASTESFNINDLP